MNFRPVPPAASGAVSVNVEIRKDGYDAARAALATLGFVRHDDFPLVPMGDGIVMLSGEMPKAAVPAGEKVEGVVAIHIKRPHKTL